MSRNRGGRFKSKPAVGDKGREVLSSMDENNPVIKMFLEFRNELDEKHDRYERIVKSSRDITIETKRIIFLLHSVNTDLETKRQEVLQEADRRLTKVSSESFKTIATELQAVDGYQYQKAYTAGLQEFIEALVFYHYLTFDQVKITWEDINKMFHYEDEENKQFKLLFPFGDFILGLADFTGELMRRCINNLGVGNTSDCFKTCDVVRSFHTGFLGLINPGNKEFGRKGFVLRQSLSKMELVCYNIKIRGSEVPKHMLASVIEHSDVNNDDDEGYF